MGVEKRKSNANAGSQPKQAKTNNTPSPNKFGKPGGNNFGGKPQGGPGGKFGGKPGGPGGKPQNQQGGGGFKKGGPGQKPAQPFPQKVKGGPPPPPEGAKKLQVETVKSDGKHQNKFNKPGKQFGNKNGVLNSVDPKSKAIHKKTPKKNRVQRMYAKLDLKVRSPGDCLRAQKAEQDMVHSGRAFTVKVSDPPITQEIVKAWSTGIETAVFTRPVEPRQFLVVFKPSANVKKEIETLKKVTFAGSKLQIEEKIDRGSEEGANPDLIDPFSLYISNLHESVTKENLATLFPKASTIAPPRKHNPKLGSSTKFAFVAFDSADDALAGFKANYQAELSGNSIIMRFRRVAVKELHHIKEAEAAKVATQKPQKEKAAPAPVAPPAAKKANLKVEQASDDEDEDQDDDDDDDDDDEEEVEGEDAGSDDDDDDEDGEDDDDDDDDDDDEEDDDE